MKSLSDIFKDKGYSRRDFLKFVTLTTAFLGLHPSMFQKLSYALENKPKPVVIWLEFQDCAGCTESFIRSTTITPTEVSSEKNSPASSKETTGNIQ